MIRGNLIHIALVIKPGTLPGNADEMNLILGLVQVGDHRVGGLKGDFVLRGAASEKDCKSCFMIHSKNSFHTGIPEGITWILV